ncbi:LamB/YcsF family protein [Spiractinospora alimapuensis]|uniref:LamB/YcsF family protein n=1 Tax=Spiractinospora alimapuensis TaxID=2820884 RepID=UPI001F1C1696|nr:5-oxoprolinase subunit PxpA [Spiractinospora alimapuensis]QVQ50199.1 LamB/YcsF family protein [Spiractinospora alimapuensis]
MKKLIDLNADAGESIGRWRLGHDEELLPKVSSVNVACGWHAGDPATMRRSVTLAQAGDTALGAHPGLPDLTGFGRRAMALSPQEAADACVYQYGALRAFADSVGVPVTHIKAHGALYGMTLRDQDLADAVADATTRLGLITVLLAGPTADRAAQRGARVAREAFADLEYRDDGTIIIEPNPEAKDPDACAEKAVGILRGHVYSTSGTRVPVDADTICIHGDRPNAVDVADAITRRFVEEGVRMAPMAEVLAARGA